MRVQRDAAQGHATSRTAADDVWGARVQSPTYSRASSTLSTRAESEEGYFSFTEDFVVQSPEKNIEAPSPLAIASPEAARSPSRMIRWSDASCEPPNADFVTDFVTATVRRLSCQRSPAELPMKPGPVSRPPALKPGPVVVPPLLSEGQDSASLSEQSANKTMPIARTGAAARRRMQRRHGVAVAARAAVWAKLVGPMMAKAKAAEATALTQQTGPADDAPATFDKPYQGQQSESGGVLGMLEVIESDFARLESDTDSAEQSAQKEYDRFMADSAEDKALKQAESEHKDAKKTDAQGYLVSTQKSLEQTQSELDAALAYYEKLKPSCIDSGETYEERVKKRKEELESLQEAYKILSGEDIPDLSAMKAEAIEA
eukprot:gnl/TRDRNA2_/TRDRNA2_173942_c3_seq1.p1 gnl/TRDRNA2_/TRDRNA2_173942_c3~~gnl/TRDRNA2_/TRDRNA2_173942_c3_seq1.p1  ORF type:complete len:405 (-),score=95.51 gnl/TRDRNA2_/TRDRNA2_173942_c3_seq1:50-1168(-)